MSHAPPAIYGGDEVSSLVIDPGSSWTRIGYAGEDTPKVVLPTYYGQNGEKTYVGDNLLHIPREGVEIKSPMNDGYVSDWENTVKIWDFALSERLYAKEKDQSLSDYPLLITEPSWNPQSNREKAAEVAFEELGVPAFYLAKNAVCSAFACGKPTALVVDVGSAVASVTPVIDGLVLKKAALHTTFAGDYINKYIVHQLKQKDVTITPHFLVSKKTPVESGQSPQVVLKNFNGLTESFLDFERIRILNEFKESTSQVLEVPYNEAIASARPQRPFEFPDGYNLSFGADRYLSTEPLFQPQLNPLPDQPVDSTALGVAGLINASVNACDVDVRANLVNNIVLIGGTSLLQGFTERTNSELVQMFPGMKIRIQAPGNSSERKYAGWIGGSILASLGTFHQMWISKKEYEEVGASIVEKRCK
ncbi:actin family [Lipomyces japonicus]|uniref:actin family n=1 Tax=Lipomyces japonicus TaxID=56871 RepID=UPI0034CDDFAD